MTNRTDYVIKNAKEAVLGKIIGLVLSFASRTIFLKCLNATYLGVNGLYSEILQILNFTELGIGAALTFAMYSPVARSDKEKTLQILKLYKKAYCIIAFVVTFIGIVLVPFLPYIIKGAESFSANELRLYFCFYLVNTVITYFAAEKISYLNALQDKYTSVRIDTITNTVITVLQMVVLIVTGNYVLYLLVRTLVLIASKILSVYYLNRKHPVLIEKSQGVLSKEETHELFREVKGLAIHKLSSVAVHATDNIIIASFSKAGVLLVGLISNYNMIIQSVVGFVSILFTSMTASFGNLAAASSKENFKKAFYDANFMNFWIYGFCSIALFVLTPHFIMLWLGKEYLVDNISFLLIIINCYLQGQSSIYIYARDACGRFYLDKWLSLAQALINLFVSIISVNYLGLVGVYIGTVVSRLVYVIVKPICTYKFLFGNSPKEYYFKLIWYFVGTLLAGCVTFALTNYVVHGITVSSFLIRCVIVTIVPNIIFFCLYFKSSEFKNMYKRIVNVIGKGRHE